MADWHFAQTDPSEELAQLHHFSMIKVQDGKEIEFRITVREYVTPMDPSMPFLATADKETNQRTAPFRPFGWGRTLLEALSLCMENVRRFPYEPQTGTHEATA